MVLLSPEFLLSLALFKGEGFSANGGRVNAGPFLHPAYPSIQEMVEREPSANQSRGGGWGGGSEQQEKP